MITMSSTARSLLRSIGGSVRGTAPGHYCKDSERLFGHVVVTEAMISELP